MEVEKKQEGRTEEENYLAIILSSACSHSLNRIYSTLWPLYWGLRLQHHSGVCLCVSAVSGWSKRRLKDQIDARHGAAALKLLDLCACKFMRSS